MVNKWGADVYLADNQYVFTFPYFISVRFQNKSVRF